MRAISCTTIFGAHGVALESEVTVERRFLFLTWRETYRGHWYDWRTEDFRAVEKPSLIRELWQIEYDFLTRHYRARK